MLFFAILWSVLALGGALWIWGGVVLFAGLGSIFDAAEDAIGGIVGLVLGLVFEVWLIYLAISDWIAIYHGHV